jgi:hypothetical protein
MGDIPALNVVASHSLRCQRSLAASIIAQAEHAFKVSGAKDHIPQNSDPT